MRGIALCLLAIVVLCSAQGCPGLSTAALVNSPIPAGSYEGDVTYDATALVSNTVPVTFDPTTSPYACEFNSAGLPLIDSNTPVAIGAAVVTTLETTNDTNMTVTAVRGIRNGVAVDYRVVMRYQDQGRNLNGTGTATDTFTLASGDRLDYTFALAIDFTLDGAPVHMVVSGNGPLTKR